jgi:hypothetical protein
MIIRIHTLSIYYAEFLVAPNKPLELTLYHGNALGKSNAKSIKLSNTIRTHGDISKSRAAIASSAKSSSSLSGGGGVIL